MSKNYDGLSAYKVNLGDGAAVVTTSNCYQEIQLENVGGVCITDPEFQQLEWVGDNTGFGG